MSTPPPLRGIDKAAHIKQQVLCVLDHLGIVLNSACKPSPDCYYGCARRASAPSARWRLLFLRPGSSENSRLSLKVWVHTLATSCGSAGLESEVSRARQRPFKRYQELTSVARHRKLGIKAWKLLPSISLGTLSDKHAYTAYTSCTDEWDVLGSRSNKKLVRPSLYS